MAMSPRCGSPNLASLTVSRCGAVASHDGRFHPAGQDFAVGDDEMVDAECDNSGGNQNLNQLMTSSALRLKPSLRLLPFLDFCGISGT